jgi:hypothetical protein
MEDQAGIDPLLPLNEVAWGLHKSTRRVRALLAEQKIPVVEFSPKDLPLAPSSLDHLVGAGEQHRRHLDAERLGSFQIDHQLEPSRLYDR